MEARRIDLTPYPRRIDLFSPDGTIEEEAGQPYIPALSLRRWLLAPARQLNGEGLVEAWDVAQHLQGDAALLSEEDWGLSLIHI